MSERKLTEKQLKFIELYNGNGTDAARKAGYDGDEKTLAAIAYENLRKPHIVQAIRERRDHEIAPLIATRARRQQFWTEIMEAEEVDLAHRLRAAELLGKSEADFKEKIEIEDKSSLAEKLAKAKRRVSE
jgi:phage terminase small subunit